MPSPALLDDAWVRVGAAGGPEWLSPVAAADRDGLARLAGRSALVLDGSGQGWLFRDGIVYQLEGESARPVAELAALAAEAGPDGSVGVLAGSDANAGLWATQPSPQPVPTPPFTPAGMSFLPAGLAVINPQNAAGLDPLASLPEAGAGVVAFSPDSRRLAAGLFRTLSGVLR